MTTSPNFTPGPPSSAEPKAPPFQRDPRKRDADERMRRGRPPLTDAQWDHRQRLLALYRDGDRAEQEAAMRELAEMDGLDGTPFRRSLKRSEVLAKLSARQNGAAAGG